MAADSNDRRRNIKRRRRKSQRRIVREKLAVMGVLILLAFAGLSVRLYVITHGNEEEYQKKILSQQRYDSTTLPFKRGTITDRNGTILAVSEKVYNVVLDCKVMLDDEKNQAPTINALATSFGLDATSLNQYVKDNPSSQYYVLKKHLTYDEISVFLEKKKEYNEAAAADKEDDIEGQVSGVWFEEEYIRQYPNNTLACDVIGFTGSDNNGTYGLEEYYNDELNGTNGREYGYLNEDATLERTTVAAQDGYSVQSTIDANIQAITEKYIRQFNDEHKDEYIEGNGSLNTGCIIMNPNTGEILAMASYPDFDLNNPKDLTGYYTQEEIEQMQADGTYYDTLNSLWRNFCISDTYEPGSTAKAITLATGIESGKITGNETYECVGNLEVGGHKIRCNVRSGHGVLDVSGALGQSCNVAFMKMGETIGSSDLLKFENIFNLGLKTNIDLAGEARTASLIYNTETMHEAEIATTSFGQGFNVTMIQMAMAYASIINGGYYYEPHVVSKITNSTGDVVRNIEPRVLKQTISATTSSQMKEYLNAVVSEGTGKTARPAGYAIGGKTGTAEKGARDKKHYVVSFLGHAPADNPEIVIYVVIDDPNVADKAHASYATAIVKNILTEVLPYLHIGMTEELTIGEQAEIDAALSGALQNTDDETSDENNADADSIDNTDNADTTTDNENSENVQQGATYVVDPQTGELIDKITGLAAELNDTYEDTGSDDEQTPQD